MYVINGIACAGSEMQGMRVSAVKPLDDMMMLAVLLCLAGSLCLAEEVAGRETFTSGDFYVCPAGRRDGGDYEMSL